MIDNSSEKWRRQWQEEWRQQEREKLRKEAEEILDQIPDGIDQFETEFGYRLELAEVEFREKGYTQSVLNSLLGTLPLWYDKFNLLRRTQLKKAILGQQEIPPGEAPVDTYRTFLSISKLNDPSHPISMGRLLARAKRLTTNLLKQYNELCDENRQLRQRVADLESRPAPQPHPQPTATHTPPTTPAATSATPATPAATSAASATPAATATPAAAVEQDYLEELRPGIHVRVMEIIACMNPFLTEEVLLAFEQSLTEIRDTASLAAHIDRTLVQPGLLPEGFARCNLMCQLYAAFSACRGRDGAPPPPPIHPDRPPALLPPAPAVDARPTPAAPPPHPRRQRVAPPRTLVATLSSPRSSCRRLVVVCRQFFGHSSDVLRTFFGQTLEKAWKNHRKRLKTSQLHPRRQSRCTLNSHKASPLHTRFHASIPPRCRLVVVTLLTTVKHHQHTTPHPRGRGQKEARKSEFIFYLRKIYYFCSPT